MSERPLIGITCDMVERDETDGVPRTYIRSVEEAGGTPVLLPNLAGDALAAHLDAFDGFLFTGGVDVDPARFGAEPHRSLGTVQPERDAFELWLAAAVLPLGRPVLGICRGCQLLAVARGARLVQDIASLRPDAIQHRQKAPRWHGSHDVRLLAGSRLAEAMGRLIHRVNSFHHQAVDEPLPPPLVVTARAPDGIVEGFEDPTHPWFVAVQWHPECMTERDPAARQLFAAFVGAARLVRHG